MWHGALVHSITVYRFSDVNCYGMECYYVFILLIPWKRAILSFWLRLLLVFYVPCSSIWPTQLGCQKLSFDSAPTWVFLPLGLLFEFWIEHVTFGRLYVTLSLSVLFNRRVSGFATDWPGPDGLRNVPELISYYTRHQRKLHRWSVINCNGWPSWN